MTQRFTMLILTALMCALFASGAQAQYDPGHGKMEKHFRETGYMYKLYEYKRWLIRAREYENGVRKGQFPIYTLVSAYTGTDNYDPFAQDTIDKLYALAFEADTHKDNPELRDKAIKDFWALLDLHMANFAVVEKILPFIRANPDLGDTKFLSWMYQQLIHRLMDSTHGKDMSQAYQLTTMAEESFILARLNVKILQTEILNNGNSYYHIHLVENLKTGDIDKIYMRLTGIMQRYAQIQKEDNPYYTYPVTIPEEFLQNR